MKLYYFYPDGYGSEYFVMSESLEIAQEKVKEAINEMAKECPSYYDEKHILDVLSRVRVVDANVVIRSELS